MKIPSGRGGIDVLRCDGLEGQIVGSTFTGRLLSGREGGCGSLCITAHGLLGRKGSGCGDAASLRHLTAHDVVGTDLVEPTSVVFMCINIELNGNLFTGLNIELLDAILAEDTEEHLTWVLAWNFNNVFLAHPRVASAS